MKIRELKLGNTRIFSATRDVETVAHPWATSVFWLDGRWVAVVTPGFVNDEPALVELSAESVKTQALPTIDGRVELVESPIIPILDTRDAAGNGAVIPPYFTALGVRDPSANLSVTESGVRVDETQNPTAGDELPIRALRAMDFYVARARPSYAVSLNFQDPETGSAVDLGVVFNTATLDERGARGRLMQAAQFEPVREPSAADRLLGNYSDDGEDRELLATVFFLSPAGVEGGALGQDWEPFVQYSPFGCWNLCHDSPNEPPARNPAPIRLFTGLAGGIGDSYVNRVLAFMDQQSDLATAAITATNNRGAFWSV